MLKFINDNGVLFSGICTVLSAVISSFITYKKGEGSKYKFFEKNDKKLDKSNGNVYVEKLHTGKSREICGACWEKEHIKIPLSVEKGAYDEFFRQYHYYFCCSCKNHYDIDIEVEESLLQSDDSLICDDSCNFPF